MAVTFDSVEALEQRLRGLPSFWLSPLRRYARLRYTAEEALEGAAIGQTAAGVERVRWAADFGGRMLLLNELDALKRVKSDAVVSLAWAGMKRGRLYVATSWMETDEREVSPIPLMQLLRQIESASRGVAAMHAAGLVHGDIKPATILRVGNRGLVSDLKLAAESGLRPDASYTPKFAAPEQILEELVGPQADVYALGVTFYTLFIRNRFPALLKTGGGPTVEADPDNAGESLSAITSIGDVLNPGQQTQNRGEDAIVGAKVTFRSRLSRVIEGVQHAELIGDLLGVIRRATDLNPARRYPHAAAFADDVKRLIDAGIANT